MNYILYKAPVIMVAVHAYIIFQAEDKRSLRSSAKTLAGHRIICQVKCCRNTGCRKIFAP